MTAETAVLAQPAVDDGRPTLLLPFRQLMQLSIYWFGINAIWGALDGVVIQARMESFVGHDAAGVAMAVAKLGGVIVAILVQPTVARSATTRSAGGAAASRTSRSAPRSTWCS